MDKIKDNSEKYNSVLEDSDEEGMPSWSVIINEVEA